MKVQTKQDYRRRRHMRLRRKIRGTAERPRMCVYVSNLHMYVQFVDDDAERTLAAASTLKLGETKGARRNDVEKAKALGREAARVAQEKGIQEVVFDRGGFSYAGRIRALAETAREAGLKF